jgi:hypothetical protein
VPHLRGPDTISPLPDHPFRMLLGSWVYYDRGEDSFLIDLLVGEY